MRAILREEIGQHSRGDAPAPHVEDGGRLFQPTGRETEAAQREERVAPPVREPRVARHDGLAVAAPHEVGVGGALEPASEARPARTLRLAQ